MCYTLNFKQSIYENYVKILLNITALKQLDNKDYSTNLKLLNRYVTAFRERNPLLLSQVAVK